MGNVTSSGQNNITSPNGNSLAVFVDGVTQVMKLKDTNGNIQPLSDFLPAIKYGSFFSTVTQSAITIYTPIAMTFNTEYFSSGCFSAILGGTSNSTNTCACAMIVGSDITADRVCTTFVNNLSIKNIPTSSVGLPSGSIYRSGNSVCIVV